MKLQQQQSGKQGKHSTNRLVPTVAREQDSRIADEPTSEEVQGYIDMGVGVFSSIYGLIVSTTPQGELVTETGDVVPAGQAGEVATETGTIIQLGGMSPLEAGALAGLVLLGLFIVVRLAS